MKVLSQSGGAGLNNKFNISQCKRGEVQNQNVGEPMPSLKTLGQDPAFLFQHLVALGIP